MIVQVFKETPPITLKRSPIDIASEEVGRLALFALGRIVAGIARVGAHLRDPDRRILEAVGVQRLADFTVDRAVASIIAPCVAVPAIACADVRRHRRRVESEGRILKRQPAMSRRSDHPPALFAFRLQRPVFRGAVRERDGKGRPNHHGANQKQTLGPSIGSFRSFHDTTPNTTASPLRPVPQRSSLSIL